jgi:2-hydroxycyclohexanecarboxyl-CoA dehydrogenase
MDSFAGRVAFITGGARGIGLAIAHSCARRGMSVAIADVDEAMLRLAVEELSAVTSARSFVLDVRDRAAYARVADAAEEQLGPVSLLVNNAGVIDSVSPALMEHASWDWVIGINLGGVYNGIQAFIPRMIRRGGEAHVVNTSSEAGLVAAGSGFLYHTSKYGVVGLSESLRTEVAHHGIGVSVLCPGEVATDIVENTRRVRPTDVPAHSARITEILQTAHTSLREHGVPPAVVGELVLYAVADNRPYIFTDGRLADLVRSRTDSLLTAMAGVDAVSARLAENR